MNLEIWTTLAEGAINFIVVNALTNASQKATVTDLKTDLRTTKEDIMAELKDTRESLIEHLTIETQAIIDIMNANQEKNSGE